MHLKKDALGNWIWRPNNRQEDFLSLPNSIFEAFYGGAAGGGKSEILLAIPIVQGINGDSDAPRLYQMPTFKGIIFRRTFPQLEESLIPRAMEAYPKFGGRYNETKHIWTFPLFEGGKPIPGTTGATVRFSYLDKDSDARDHDTAEYNYCGFDELTHFSDFMYLYLMSRVRTSDPLLPAFLRSASNPGNIGHAWVKSRFIKPAPNGYTILKDANTGTCRIFIPAKLQDNPDLAESDPDYANRLKNLPEAERRAKLDGDWDIYEGQVFTEYRRKHLPSEPENAVHVCQPFEIPAYWPIVLALDWGYTARTVGHILAISPDERVFLVRRYSAVKTKIAVWASDIARIVSEFPNPLRSVELDPSAWKEDGHEKTIAAQFQEHSALIPRKADNDRLGGLQLLHEYFRFEARPPRYIPPTGYSQEVADYILRVRGTRALAEYHELFTPQVPETNLPKFQVFDLPEMEMFHDTVLACTYNSDAIAKERKEDVKEFDGDDDYDCIRYGIKAVHRYVAESKREFAKVQERAKILNQLKTGEMDMTSFYIHMNRFEKKSHGPKPVKRGGRIWHPNVMN